MPPIKAIITIKNDSELTLTPLLICPDNPATELTHINKADTAAASFIFPQWNNKMIGLKIIPPPISFLD